jgi:hypothetical protein
VIGRKTKTASSVLVRPQRKSRTPTQSAKTENAKNGRKENEPHFA